jgi:methylenetetrahydrofolate reductase (NADPH)
VNSAAADADLMTLAARIAQFVRRASTEITTYDHALIPQLAAMLPVGTTVYVAHTPRASLDDVVHTASAVQAAGLRASPHIVARRLAGEPALRAALARLSEAGVEQVLVVAGDLAHPAGPFASSLDVLASGALRGSGIRRIGFAGHPEGHPSVAEDALWESLRRKQARAAQIGLRAHVVTQFGFDADAVCDWVRRLGAHGIALPVHVGVAGPTSVSRLLKFAMQCGVGASVHAAVRGTRAAGRLMRSGVSPERMITGLLRQGAGFELGQIEQPHFFGFGGALVTAHWLARIGSGAFIMHPQGPELDN